MVEVTIYNGKKIIRRQRFRNEDEAWDYAYPFEDRGFSVVIRDV